MYAYVLKMLTQADGYAMSLMLF